jgi:glycosyltransferase involved in cell wall biosynthesis
MQFRRCVYLRNLEMLTVLNVAYPLVPVSPDTAGGAEQVVSLLDAGLGLRGHRSLVLAANGSSVQGDLIATPDWGGPIDAAVRTWAAQEHARALTRVLESRRVDIVHLHGLDFADYLPAEPIPCVITLHLPPGWYSERIFQLKRPNTVLVCVSSNQRSQMPPATLPVKTIPDAIDKQRFGGFFRKRDYAAVIGRVCPEKSFHFAIDAAQSARIPLMMAGEVFGYEAHRRYFAEQIEPRLGPGVRFLGPAGLRRKRRLMAAARCILIPSTAPETSSLVAMEAMASGTPVIAFRSGALPEIVEDGKTGFLVDDAAAMAEAIRRADDLDPEECRRAARIRFSAERMVDEYIELYRELSHAASQPARSECLTGALSQP